MAPARKTPRYDYQRETELEMRICDPGARIAVNYNLLTPNGRVKA